MNKNFTKRLIAITVLLGLQFVANQLQAQCMLKPTTLASKIINTSMIVEGKVIAAQCLWDEQAHNIYTVYDVEVYRYYKGGNGLAIVKVIDQGGTVGLQKHVVTNDLHLRIGNAGIFMLIANNDPFSTTLQYMETYAGPQGFIAYNNFKKNANSVFETYENVNTELLSVIQNTVGQPATILKTLDWNTIVDARNEEHHDDNSNSNFQFSQSNALQSSTFSGSSSNALIAAGATITSFSPTSINAGNNSILTINGSGFGATQGTSTVQFKNADDGGLSNIAPLPSQYISWSNTQIQVKVPSPAGTGVFLVTDGTNTVVSSSALNVGYHLSNFTYNVGAADTAYLAKHVNDNTTGGYTYQCFTGFASNTAALADFTNLTQAWRCTTGINWIIGANTSVNVSANDGVNIVRFDVGSELGVDVLGVAISRYSGCFNGDAVQFYLQEVDVIFDDATSWFYGNVGTPTFSQIDFYSVGVHELGHAHQLGHVIDPAKIMHYSMFTGIQNRTLSPSELAGGNFMIDYAASNPYCGTALHVKYSCIPKVALSVSTNSVAENVASITVLATMNGVNDSNVTVNLITSGTATFGGVDYNLPATIVVPAGTNTASVTMTIVNDALFEGNENVIIDIVSVTNGTEDGVQQQTVTIVDNEIPPTVTLTNSNNSIVENVGTTTLTATLSAISGLATTVNMLYTNGSGMTNAEYTNAANIVIPAGALSSNIVLTSVDDADDEANETITAEISSINNGTFTTAQPKIITVLDDENAEFDLLQNQIAVANSSTQSFGNITIANSVLKIYAIKNTGNFPLTWSANIAGTNASKFVLQTTGSAATILPGDSTQITIEATPICGDSFITATLNFVNNDDDENPTTITLTALATDAAPVPDITNLPTAYGTCTAGVSAPSATDFCDGTIVATTSGATTFATQGTFNVIWLYTDSKGNTVQQTQSVIVNDTLAPIPDVASLPTITANCDTIITVYPTATDNCGAIITATTANNLNFSGASTNTIIWNYTDANGNIATQNQTVEIISNKPNIVLADTIISGCEGDPYSISASGALTYVLSTGYNNNEVAYLVNGIVPFTVIGTNAFGCTNIVEGGTYGAVPTLAPLNNLSSNIAGTECKTNIQVEGIEQNYHDGAFSCNNIVSIYDTIGGNNLGNVTACVTITDSAQVHNGQPYLPRTFDIVPSSQGPAQITFYFSQADFDIYNAKANALGYPIIPASPINNFSTVSFSISQVPGGNLASSNGNTTIEHQVVANYHAGIFPDVFQYFWTATINVNSFSGFYAHSTNPNNAPLGITDITLQGKYTSSGGLLTWNVPLEKEVKNYSLLHSVDGINFTAIHNQTAQNTYQSETYHYLHADYLQGNHYYKTMANMQNGTTVFSNIVKLSNSNTASGIIAYPNPASDVIQVQTTISAAASYQFVLRDAIGKTIKTVNTPLQIGTNTTEINVQEIACGSYTLQVIANGKMMEVLKVKVVK
jgi:Secretion system C-terminal sorting domain/Calx-beta domain/IPT/TIG domain